MEHLMSLLSENVKRLKLVECKFDKEGGLILISGENDQGKSSLLDSIEMLFSGAKSVPKVPIRKGQETARIIGETETLIIEVNFQNDKKYLRVTNKEGFTAPSPQTMLDELKGKLSFDPLLFVNSKPKEQIDILLSLGQFGEDPRKIDARIKIHYDNRTFHNREHKKYKGLLEAMSGPTDDLPDKKVSITDINDEKNEALRKNGLKDKLIVEKVELVKSHDAITVDINNLGERKEELQAEIKTVDNTLNSKEASMNQAIDNIEQKKEEIDRFAEIDISEFDIAIEKAEITNEQIAQSESYQNIHKLADGALESADKETTEIECLQSKKATELKNAKLPIDSIAYDEDGVIYQDLPFNQASDSDKTKISFQIAKALNPELKLIMSKEGDKLGKKKLLELTQLAKDEGYLFLIERIHDDGLPAIIIEDGMIKK